MGNKFDKADQAFYFFKKCRDSRKSFELEDIKNATEWNFSTIKTYLTKRWNVFLNKKGSHFEVNQNFDSFTIDTFRQHHSQKDRTNKFFYQLLLEKSVTACISAIEIYNKPDFKFREENFSILMVNAWELLLKAKILQENEDNTDSIYFLEKNKPKLTDSGSPKTISTSKSLHILESSGCLKSIVADSIRALVEIRDISVHFIHNDLNLNAKIQSIGTASLKNFMTLAQNWFGYDFQKFNFYLMPISFYHLSDVESFSIDKSQVENLFKYLNGIEKKYDEDEDPDFCISLRLETKLVKRTLDEALQIRTTDDPNAPELLISEEDALKSYPYTYNPLCKKLRERYIDFKQNAEFHDLMRNLIVQGDKFCKERRLNPQNPKSTCQRFYHSRIIEEFDKHYTKI